AQLGLRYELLSVGTESPPELSAPVVRHRRHLEDGSARTDPAAGRQIVRREIQGEEEVVAEQRQRLSVRDQLGHIELHHGDRAPRACCGSWVANTSVTPRRSRSSSALAKWIASGVRTTVAMGSAARRSTGRVSGIEPIAPSMRASSSCTSATPASSSAPSSRSRSITRRASTPSSSLE